MTGNQTWVTEFILLGFPLSPKMRVLLFGLFSLFFAFTLLGNGVILGLIWLDSRLHTPMYFFLSHLAIVDISYASNNVPKMLANLLNKKRTISFAPCIMQTFLYMAFAHTECLILVMMSYDRYVAICHPLHYSVIMSWRVCTIQAITSWVCGSLLALVHVVLILRLPFCGPCEINHFFCELLSVLKLACADTSLNQVVIFAASVFILVGPLCLVLVSYTRILFSILRIQAAEGSGCGSCKVSPLLSDAVSLPATDKGHCPSAGNHMSSAASPGQLSSVLTCCPSPSNPGCRSWGGLLMACLKMGEQDMGGRRVKFWLRHGARPAHETDKSEETEEVQQEEEEGKHGLGKCSASQAVEYGSRGILDKRKFYRELEEAAQKQGRIG
nr:olfactory receptor 2A5-like [Vicugna pacos]